MLKRTALTQRGVRGWVRSAWTPTGGCAGNGLIDFDEFCEMMSGRLPALPSSSSSVVDYEPGSPGDLRSLFMAFDKDNNGYIDADELRQTMSAVGLQLSDRDVSMMMNAAGVPSRGRIYYEGEPVKARIPRRRHRHRRPRRHAREDRRENVGVSFSLP